MILGMATMVRAQTGLKNVPGAAVVMSTSSDKGRFISYVGWLQQAQAGAGVYIKSDTDPISSLSTHLIPQSWFPTSSHLAVARTNCYLGME
jgi:hypothetical protein